ncbi:MAG: hypothetical protein WAT79_08570 [Saprospiraceae bacterium]
MKTYIAYRDEHAVHIYDIEKDSFFDVEDIKDAGLDKRDFIITCNQDFVIRNKQIDICMVEKMIYFPGPKNLQRLFQKYTHKSFQDENKIKSIIKAIHTVYKRQQPFIKELKLEKAILFNSEIAGTIAYINIGKIKIKDSYIKEQNEISEKLNLVGQMGRNELISYMESKKYKCLDITTGKYNLTHKYLLSFNDEILNRHVEVSSKKSEYFHYSQYAKKEIPINHKPYGAITGRITTTGPNIQGIDPSIIEGNIWSFDFTGFEIMIYLCLYKKSICDDFIHSEKKDIYGYIFWELYPDKYGYDSDSFKKNNPDTRKSFKDLCIKVLYGATLDDCRYMFGDKIDKTYNKVFNYFDVSRVKKQLLDYATKSGSYLLNNKYNFSTSDENVDILHRLLPEAKKVSLPDDDPLYYSDHPKNKAIKSEFNDIFAKERGILLQVSDKFKKVNKYLVNYNIQATGAIIIKLAAKYAIATGMKSKILILRHDEIIADIVTEQDKKEIAYAMQDACKEVILSYINIDIKKL